MVDLVKVGMRISEHRKRAGLSQEELASKLFVTRQALSKWENGTGAPSIDTLVRLREIFGVSFEELLGLFESDRLSIDEEDIFGSHDRPFVIEKIVEGRIKVNLPDVLYQMSPAERMYILRQLKDGVLTVRSKRELWAKLTPSEKKFLGGTTYEICESDHRWKRALPSGKR